MERRLRLTVLAVLAVIWLLPTYLFVANSLKSNGSFATQQVWLPPTSLSLLDNLESAQQKTDLASTILPTVLYSVLSPVIGTVIGALAGFAMVVLKVRRATLWFAVIFSASVLPAQMLLVPLFVGYVSTGLFDTRAGLVLIHVALVVPFATLVMRNFFVGINPSMFDAARVDGVSPLGAFWRIYLPLSTTAMVAIFVLQATFTWNDVLFGLTLSHSDGVRPLVTALLVLTGTGSASVPIYLSAALAASLPTVILYLVSRRYFREGLVLGY